MVTLRTYWNGVEAALAKSVLDDHQIFCSLADENANLYGGGPLAMPIRLLVDKDQAEPALRILDGDLEAVGDIDATGSAAAPPSEIAAPGEMLNDNPWELLVVAFCFVIPGVCVLQTKYPTMVGAGRRTGAGIAAVSIIHFLGWLAVVFGMLLLAVYLYLRRSSLDARQS
ncbi:MAG TPA: DUF2007 domain-containing protein [Chthoniobacterales bacterium]|jgi:hypothetical protein|nr:DUF2007 domain-containing protein [Chthoniobacterales bacterium]